MVAKQSTGGQTDGILVDVDKVVDWNRKLGMRFDTGRARQRDTNGHGHTF